MADIFLSYTEKDRDTARRLAEALASVGWEVWWDRRIPAGDTWRSVLEKALENMRCMVVLWSARSIESEWVYEEATEGRRQGKLVPVLIEAVRPPAGFREIQAADLAEWDGSPEFEGLRMLVADLESLIGKPDRSATKPPSQEDQSGIGGETTEGRGPAYDPADLAFGTYAARGFRWPLRSVRAWSLTGALLLVVGAAYVVFSVRPAPVKELPALESIAIDTNPAAPLTAAVPATAEPPAAPIVQDAATEVPAVAPASVASPVEVRPAKPRPPVVTPIVKYTQNTRPANKRCVDLISRVQLGETLSGEAQSVFQKECRQ